MGGDSPKNPFHWLDVWGRIKDAWEALPEAARKRVTASVGALIGGPLSAVLALASGYWQENPLLFLYFTLSGAVGVGGVFHLSRELWRASHGPESSVAIEAIVSKTERLAALRLENRGCACLVAGRLVGIHMQGGPQMNPGSPRIGWRSSASVNVLAPMKPPNHMDRFGSTFALLFRVLEDGLQAEFLTDVGSFMLPLSENCRRIDCTVELEADPKLGEECKVVCQFFLDESKGPLMGNAQVSKP